MANRHIAMQNVVFFSREKKRMNELTKNSTILITVARERKNIFPYIHYSCATDITTALKYERYVSIYYCIHCMQLYDDFEKICTKTKCNASHLNKNEIRTNVEYRGVATANGMLMLSKHCFAPKHLCNFVFVNLLCISDRLKALLPAILSDMQN